MDDYFGGDSYDSSDSSFGTSDPSGGFDMNGALNDPDSTVGESEGNTKSLFDLLKFGVGSIADYQSKKFQLENKTPYVVVDGVAYPAGKAATLLSAKNGKTTAGTLGLLLMIGVVVLLVMEKK